MHDIDNDFFTKGHNQRPDWSMLERWHHVQVDFRTGKSLEILDWLNAAPGERYYWTLSGNIWFEREEDLVLFKLTWC